ncbi:MAG: tRNA (adenosine(37)-N6)-threonylcarbamoyltransferase complex ATPase subunit type 1 TsaE [Patescibacteria group bacterium]|nr:tRNA (adenosine(37)-N6)-threonylcarbamoyltransferase complex ATPase subunit type 1 TsaE [Patescibacteria group bacterium]
MIKIISFSPAVTKKIGAAIARQISNHSGLSQGPVFVLLEGNLGAGKTTFTLGFLQYFGIKPAAASPTFVIAKRYETRRRGKACPVVKLISTTGGERGKYNSRLKTEKLDSLTTSHQSQVTVSNIWHIDAYRLKSKKDLELIGFTEIKKQPHMVVIMEWPGNVNGMKLKNVIRVRFEHGTSASERVIIIR